MKHPNCPKFMFAPDHNDRELYIIHTQHPLAVIWVYQSTPAKLFVIHHERFSGNVEQTLTSVLQDAAEFYRHYASEQQNKN